MDFDICLMYCDLCHVFPASCVFSAGGEGRGKPQRRSDEETHQDGILDAKKHRGSFSFQHRGDLHTRFPVPLMVVMRIICPTLWEENKLEKGETEGIQGENI